MRVQCYKLNNKLHMNAYQLFFSSETKFSLRPNKRSQKVSK